MDSISKNAMKIYNKYAKSYEERTKDYIFHQEDRELFVKILEDNHGESARVIDIGCGPGRDALYFKEQGLDVTCFDLSEEMLNLCKKKGLDKLKQGSFTDLPFANESFDGAWSYTSQTTNTKQQFENIVFKLYNTLTKNGILFLGLIEGEGEEWKPPNKKYNIKRYVSRYTLPEVYHIGSKAGFTLNRFNRIPKELTRRNTYLHFLFQKVNS